MKALAIAFNSVRVGDANCIIVGGMESMSQAPYYLPASARKGRVVIMF